MIAYRTDLVPATDGIRLALYRYREKAPTSERAYLLVHGLASNARLYDGVAERLTGMGARVAAVDLRGHGGSDKPEEGYDYETMSKDLLFVLERLEKEGWPEQVIAVGQSFGANLVLELAARYGERLAGVVCIDGGTIDLKARFSSWEEAEDALRPPSIEGMPISELEARLRAMHPDWPETGIAGTLANFALRGDGTVAPHLSLDRHMRIVRTMWESRPSDLYQSLSLPVLFVPARSKGAPAAWAAAKEQATAEALAAIGRAEAHVMEGDHDLHAQHPAEVASLLEEAAGRLFRKSAGESRGSEHPLGRRTF